MKDADKARKLSADIAVGVQPRAILQADFDIVSAAQEQEVADGTDVPADDDREALIAADAEAVLVAAELFERSSLSALVGGAVAAGLDDGTLASGVLPYAPGGVSLRLFHAALGDALLDLCGVPLTVAPPDAPGPAAPDEPIGGGAEAVARVVNVQQRVKRVLMQWGRQTLSWPTLRAQLLGVPGMSAQVVANMSRIIAPLLGAVDGDDGAGGDSGWAAQRAHAAHQHNRTVLARLREAFAAHPRGLLLVRSVPARAQRVPHALHSG